MDIPTYFTPSYARETYMENASARQQLMLSQQHGIKKKNCWLCVTNDALCSFRSQKYVTPNTSGSSSGSKSVTVRVESTPLCYKCAKHILLGVALPRYASTMRQVVREIQESIQALKEMDYNSPLTSPRTVGTAPNPFSSSSSAQKWACSKCTLINPPTTAYCEACNSRRVQLVCPYCGYEALTHKYCRAKKVPHRTWQCKGCDALHLDHVIQCNRCLSYRTWFCDACGLENTANMQKCAACGSLIVHGVATLKSFFKKQDIKSDVAAGIIDSLEMERERKQAEMYEEHLLRMQARLDDMGMHSVEIADDGNCLFRAMASQLFRDEDLHVLLRLMIAEFMEAKADEYMCFIGAEEFGGYIQKIKKVGEWGDELCVQAAAALFRVRVHVVTSDETRWHLDYKPPGFVEQRQQQQAAQGSAASRNPSGGGPSLPYAIFLSYISPVHYNAFVPSNPLPRLPFIDLGEVLSRPSAAADLIVDDSFSTENVSSISTGAQRRQQQERQPEPQTIIARRSSNPMLTQQQQQLQQRAATLLATATSSHTQRQQHQQQQQEQEAKDDNEAPQRSHLVRGGTGATSPSRPTQGLHELASGITNSPASAQAILQLLPYQIPRLKHAVVVIVRLGAGGAQCLSHDPRSSGGSSLFLEPQASRFYLHPISTEGASAPTFYLQDITSGYFLCPVPQENYTTTSVLDRYERYCHVNCAPVRLTNLRESSTDRKNVEITILPSGIFAFRHGHVVPQMLAVEEVESRTTHLPHRKLVAVTDEVAASGPFSIDVLFGKAPERYCIFCQQWYNEQTVSECRAHDRQEHFSFAGIAQNPTIPQRSTGVTRF